MNRWNTKQWLNEKLFNGYVREPIPMAFFACLVGMILLIMALWATSDVYLLESGDDTITEECVFVESRKQESSYVLVSDDGKLFTLLCDSVKNKELLNSIITNNETILVTYELPTNDNKDMYDILSIADMSGKNIVKFADVAEAEKRANNLSVLILWVACSGYWIIITAMYLVICNAPRFPKLASLFVRAPFRNF